MIFCNFPVRAEKNIIIVDNLIPIEEYDNRCFWEIIKNVKTLRMYANIINISEVDKTWMQIHVKDIGKIERQMNETRTSHSMITTAKNMLKPTTAIVHLPFMREDTTEFYECAKMSEVEIHIVTSSDNMEYRYYVKITRDDIYLPRGSGESTYRRR
jgi:hypothetical protein